MEKAMNTVKWFTVNSSFTDSELCNFLGGDLTQKPEIPWVFAREVKSVVWHSSPEILKVDLTQRDLIARARTFAQELGDS